MHDAYSCIGGESFIMSFIIHGEDLYMHDFNYMQSLCILTVFIYSSASTMHSIKSLCRYMHTLFIFIHIHAYVCMHTYEFIMHTYTHYAYLCIFMHNYILVSIMHHSSCHTLFMAKFYTCMIPITCSHYAYGCGTLIRVWWAS